MSGGGRTIAEDFTLKSLVFYPSVLEAGEAGGQSHVSVTDSVA